MFLSSQNPNQCDHQRNMSEGMEALRHIATTSLFLQNEKHPNEVATAKSNVPIIKEPDKSSGAFLFNLFDSEFRLKPLCYLFHRSTARDETN